MDLSIKFTDEDGGIHSFSDTTLLIFVDETGEENFSDKNYPLFGFGGCIVMAKDYPVLVAEWKKVEASFPTNLIPLHASDLVLKNMTKQNYSAFDEFFTNGKFGRFASIMTNITAYDIEEEIIQAAAIAVHPRIVHIAKWMSFTQIVMIFEKSERTKFKVSNYFSNFSLEENGNPVSIARFFMTKEENEAGLTVADFIIHTAGATVQSGLKKDGQGIKRKDFKIIFKNPDEKLCQFMQIQHIRK